MRTARHAYLVLLLTAGVLWAQGSKPAPPPGLPGTPGVYVEAGTGQWAALHRIEVRDSSIKRMDVFLDTGGVLPMDMNCVFPGPAAALQLSASQPVFFVKGVENPKEALIARLTKRKDSRTLKTRSSEASTGNKAGISWSDAVRVTVTAVEGGGYSVKPVEALKPGEYLLTFGAATSGYEFRVSGTDQ